MLRISNPLMAIGASQFALSLMQVIFMFYYVKVYLNVFHVSQWWFNVAQALFMIWNAVNDPLFGYLQDTHSGWLKSRTAVIKYFSPFLCGSFVFLWYPWNLTGSWLEGVHLIIALFFYDAFFSAMGVAWSALFADSTRDDRSRAAAMKYSQVAILCSVNGIAVMEKASHSLDNFSAFFVVAVIVAFVSLLCLLSAGSLRDDKLIFSRDEFSDSLLDSENSHPESSWVHALRLTKETIHQKNFLFIVATNFIHIMRSVSHLNFASITTEILIPQEFLPKGSLRLSIFYGVCTLGPQVIIICLERVVVRVGAARLMLASHLASVVSALSMALFSHVPLAVITFMIVDSINVHSAAPLFNIVISEYIDNDSRRRARRSPISSFIFSLNALFTKPAQSVAPVVVVYILNLYGYQEYLTTKIAAESLQLAVRYILYGTPLFLGLAQYIVFRNYGLFSKKNSKELIM